jgi:hypothetical protein
MATPAEIDDRPPYVSTGRLPRPEAVEAVDRAVALGRLERRRINDQ